MNTKKMPALVSLTILFLFVSNLAIAQSISLPDNNLTNTKYCTWFGGYWDGDWTTSTIDAQNDTVVINGVISGISLHDAYLEVGFITDRQYNFIMNNHPTEPEDWFNQGAYMLFYEWTSGGNWSFAQIQDYQGEGSSVSLTWVSSYNFKVVFKPNLGGAGGTADLYMNGVLVEKDHVYGTPQTPGWWSAYDTTGEEDFTQAHLIVQLWASVSGKTVSYSNLSAQSIAEYNSTFEIDVANHLPDKVTNAQIRTGVTAGETDDAKLVVSIPSGFQFSEPSGVPANTVVGDGYSEEDPSHLFTLKTTGTQNHWVMYSSIHGPVATVNVYPNDSLVYNYGDDGNLTQEFTWHLLLTLYGSLPPYGNVIQNPSAIGDYVFDATFHSEAGQVTTVHDTVTISQPSEVWVDDDFTPSTPGWGYDHFDKVQDGIDAVAAGGTVNVLAGTYTEQITIDKSLILLGAGQYSTTIKAQPADRPGIVTEGGSIWDYIVAAYPSSASIDVKIQGFTIDANGENKSIGADRFAGVFFRDVDGTDAGLYSCTIKNFGNNLYQNWGIWVCGASDLIIDGNTLSDYTRDGIVVNGDAGPATDPSVVISNNYLTGSALPLNGIQIGRGATGTISGNTVKDHTRSSPWAAVGILIYASDGITINGGNTVENCFYGIHLEQSSGSLVSGNELMKNIAFHIGLSQSNNNQVSGNTITGTTAGTEDKAISLSQDATGNSIGGLTPADGNDITLATSGSGLLYVVYVQSTVGAGSNTVQYNTANGGTRFVQVDGGNTGTTTITDNTVTGTSFAGVFLNAGNAVLSRNVLTNTIRPVEFWGAMNVTILENIIDGSTFDGINCGSFTGSVTVSGNAIYNTTGKGIWNRTATLIDASGNWWGISNPTDIAGEVSTNVDYTPWLDDGTDKDPLTPGFQGDFSVVNVDDNSPQTGTTGRIQEGVDMVTASTVKVMAGTYYENIVINKALSLMGASQDSVLVYTDSSDVGIPNPELGPSFRGSQMVVVEATDVLIEGFTFNGDNPSLTPAGVVDARNGIITNYNSGNWNNLTVQNCTVKNIYLRGIYACAMSATPGDLTGIDFNHNTVNNVKGASFQSAGLMFWGASGTMFQNTVSNSSIGTMFHISSDGYLDSNYATTCEVGFAVNSNDQPTTISGNTVTNSGQGIQTISIDDLITISDNNIANCTTGIVLYGGGGGLNDVVDNLVEGPGVLRATGLYASTDISPWGMGDLTATLRKNTIKDNFLGIIFSEPDTNRTKLVTTTISGSSDDINFIYNNSSFEVLMEYCDDDINAQYNYWGKSRTDEVEEEIYHKVDQADLGLVTFSHPILHGDVNLDGEVSIADVVYLINYLFRSGPAPSVPIVADINGDGEINVEDAVYLTNYLFKSGPPPIPPPYIGSSDVLQTPKDMIRPDPVYSTLR